MRSHTDHPEVKSTPEQQRYVIHSFGWTYLAKPTLHKCAWVVSSVLSFGAVIPLTFKCVVNAIDAVFDRRSLKESGKNLGSILAFPLLGSASALSVIPLPYFSKIGSKLVKMLMLPIIPIYSLCHKTFKSQIATMMPLHPNLTFPEVRVKQNVAIDTVDIASDTPTSQYRIVFNAAAEIYQMNFYKMKEASNKLNCHTRSFNYPGITNNGVLDSLDDLINSGIAQVYDLVKKQNWTNAEIEKNLHLYGYCFGGGIALQVAAFFKRNYNVNIRIFVDRSFTSMLAAATGLMNELTGLPTWYTKLLCASYLYAGGEFNMDSMAAIKELNLSNIYYVNLGTIKTPTELVTFFQKYKKFLGIGKNIPSPDSIICGGAALADGLDASHIICGRKTSEIFTHLNISSEHRFYSSYKETNGHFLPLNCLSIDKKSEENKTAFDYYIQTMKDTVEEKSSQTLRIA